MLLADKLDLQNKLKVNILQIEERELNFYTNNAYAIGTQAALLAGFAFTGIIEAPWETIRDQPKELQVCCVVSTLLGMLFEILAVVKSVQISILGPGLALRGPEGSMTQSLRVMRREQARVHWQFYLGVFAFHVSAACFCFAIFDDQTGIACATLLGVSCAWMIVDCQHVAKRLWLPPPAPLWKEITDGGHGASSSAAAGGAGGETSARSTSRGLHSYSGATMPPQKTSRSGRVDGFEAYGPEYVGPAQPDESATPTRTAPMGDGRQVAPGTHGAPNTGVRQSTGTVEGHFGDTALQFILNLTRKTPVDLP